MNFIRKIYSLEYKDKLKVFLFSFSALLLSFAIAFLPYFIRGKSFVWIPDGINQHLPFMEYEVGTNAIKKLFTGAFDFNLGLGNDYVFALAYYMLTDPFNIFFFILCFLDNAVIYSIIVALKLFTIFYVMFFFLKHKNVKPFFAVLGAVCYMLVGTSIFSVLRHPQFATGIIFFPLIVWGAQNVMENKRPYLLIASVLLCLLSNYYQFYICAVCLAIFAIFYYFILHPTKNEKFSFKKFALCLLKVALFSAIGVLIGAVMLVPVLYGILRSARGTSKGFGLTTGLNLKNFFFLVLQFVIPYDGMAYNMLGLNIALLILASLFIINKNKGSALLACFICFMFLPIFSYATNAFNYYSGRWLFVLSFLIIAASIIMLEKVDGVTSKTKQKVIKVFLAEILLILMIIANYFLAKVAVASSKSLAIFVILLISTLTCCIIIVLFKKIKIPPIFEKIISVKLLVPILICLTLANATVYNIIYSRSFASYPTINQSLDFEKYVAQQNKGKFARVDMGQQMGFVNLNLNKNYLSTFMYNSSTSGEVYNFLKMTGLSNTSETLGIKGLESRVALQSLLNVNYYVATDDIIPYGYEKVEGYKNLYQNKNALEFGSFYTDAVSSSVANNLTLDQRGNLMLEAIVLEDDSLDYTVTPINEDLVFEEEFINCKQDKQKITANAKAQIKLTISGCSNKEVYINLKDFGYNFENRSRVLNFIDGNVTRYSMTVESGQRKLSYIFSPPTTQHYISSKSDYCINLGYTDSNQIVATINLPEGSYYCKDLSVSGYNMQRYQQNIDKMKSGPQFTLENFENYDGNSLTGKIENDKDGYLFLSIPYSNGWSAKVDGKTAKILHANYGFIAIKLDAGSHKIELEYKSEGKNIGIALSVVGIVCLGIIIGIDIFFLLRKKKKRV